MSSAALSQVKRKLEECSQTNLLRFWDDLNDQQKESFIDHLNSIKLEEVDELFKRALNSLNEDVKKLDSRMKPIPPTQFESEEKCRPEKLEYYRRKGLEEISKGRVGVLLMAGGQGTRIGVDYPKGMYSVNLPSGKTLFQIQAERMRRLQNLAEEATERCGKITWYIMTSGPTNEATQDYLQKNDYFGLNPDDIVLFKQGLLPCFDFDGHIILEDKDRVALAPDGNGGIYRALEKNGILKDMAKRGVKYVHAYSVDNILVKVADPVFIGYCIEKNADCGAKVVQKASPTEAVGVVCQVDGRFQVVEYSEITEKTANLRDDHNNLVFNAGNICNHFFTTEFLQRVVDRHEKDLKLHVAKKRIVYVNDDGEKIRPKQPNGIKIEKFVFDVFPFAKNFVTWEVPRYSEFSALKNSDDVKKDCPSTARRDLLALHKIYVEKNGGTVEEGVEVEISPLLSYAGENLKDLVNGRAFTTNTLLTPADQE